MANVDSYIPLFGRDFLTATMGWTAEERGHYIVLLITQWEQGSIPADPGRLEMASPGISGCWELLSQKFPPSEDGLRRNRRLEEHRAKASSLSQARAEKAARAARARWGKDAPSIAQASPQAMLKHENAASGVKGAKQGEGAKREGNAVSDAPSNAHAMRGAMLGAMLEQCPPSPSPIDKKEELRSSSCESGPIPEFACESGTWKPTREMIEEWKATYPDLDLMAQLRRARQWCIDNVDRRKTQRGMRRFIGSWLANVKVLPKQTSPSKKVLASLED